jgi:hypothetical protein
MMGLFDTSEAGPVATTLRGRFDEGKSRVWIARREVGRVRRENDRFVTVDTKARKRTKGIEDREEKDNVLNRGGAASKVVSSSSDVNIVVGGKSTYKRVVAENKDDG